MTRGDQLEKQVRKLETLLEEKFGVSRGPFEKRIAKPGRMLPRWVRRDLGTVAETRKLMGHPKIGRQLDLAAAEKAATRATSWLKSVDVAERRKTRILHLTGAIALNVLLVFAALIAVLRWRGFV